VKDYLSENKKLSGQIFRFLRIRNIYRIFVL